ncbi:MAG: sugar ABC transporter permease [Actinomycetota bacterium]|nr:sugar ABC transporter permease [Actinomycetota bacterium]
MVLVGVFLVFPAIWTLYLGLLHYSLTGSSAAAPQFAGTSNYTDALKDPTFTSALWLTLVYVALSAVLGQNILGFLLAWFFKRTNAVVRSVLTVLVLLAWILPGSVVAFLWQALLDRRAGTLNGILGTQVPWALDQPMAVIIIFNIWRGTAFSMLLYAAALSTVPQSHLEVGRMSGASGFQQLRDIVVPTVRRNILTNTLLITLWTFNDFTPYLLTGGGPDGASETLPVYIYKTAIIGGQLGYGSAISLLLLLVNLIIAVVYIRFLRGSDDDAALARAAKRRRGKGSGPKRPLVDAEPKPPTAAVLAPGGGG